MVRKHLAAHARFACGTEHNGVGQFVGDQWTAALVRMTGFHVLFLAEYLETGVGLGGVNLQSAIGDWNETPQALIDVQWA